MIRPTGPPSWHVKVRGLAAAGGDLGTELAACMELGQDLMGSPLGESFTPTAQEGDFEAAEEPFSRAAAIAAELPDKARLAAATRELGVIGVGRVRSWFVERFKAGEQMEILRHIAAGASLDDIMATLPIASLVGESLARLQRALELFEELDDRRGAMSAIIAMAYLSWAPDVHVGASAGRRIEEIRRLASRLRSLSHESERAAAEAQMLYGVHVFCRAKVIPDLALARGREAHEHARRIGDRSLEFFAAGGTAMACADLGDFAEAKRWLDRAAGVAAAAPTSARARQLDLWRGLLAAATGDVESMHRHLGQALDMAGSQDRRAARCEILAAYALECARLGTEGSDATLTARAEELATEANRVAAALPGKPPWGAQANVALATVAFARAEQDRALELARAALAFRHDAMREDPHLEILLPAARVLLAAGDESDIAAVRNELQLHRSFISQRTLDGDVRAQWWRGPQGRELARLAGAGDSTPNDAPAGAPSTVDARRDDLTADERRLLALLIEGRTNGEIAEETGVSAESVGHALVRMYARIGAASRAEATVLALSGQV